MSPFKTIIKHGASIKTIIKRDASRTVFDKAKIANAIAKAAKATAGITSRKFSERLADAVMVILQERFQGKKVTVEDVQDVVETVLIEQGHATIAKAYILYRQQRKHARQQTKAILGVEAKTSLSLNALRILKERILPKNEEGEVIETPDEMFWRVAKNVAKADRKYDKKRDVKATAKEFHDLMASLDFLPNSPTLMNAGTGVQQLMACFVLPVPDSIEGIFETLKRAAIIHKTGGGTGFSFSNLRPKKDYIAKTRGESSGPISFIHAFNAATDIIKRGGRQRGANMAILRVDHPDILEFIVAKENPQSLTNFNLSVGVTKAFMDALKKDKEYALVNPRTKEAAGMLRARHVFELLCFQAWKHGEPGVVFLDRINAANPTPTLGEIEATDSCAGQPLLPYEACCLGSINLAHMAVKGKINVQRLRATVRTAVHFLDNSIDTTRYPLRETEKLCKANRKIGLGVMGFADLLIQLEIPYNSKEAVGLAEKVMGFIQKEARITSQQLAKKRGVFPNWKRSRYAQQRLRLRNATCTTISPTGTISMLADVSSGIEPNLALCYYRMVMGKKLLFVNRYVEQKAREKGFYSELLVERMKNQTDLQHINEVPERWRKVFVTAMNVAPEWHVRVQAAFQKYTDNAISKTINFPYEAQIEDVKKAYLLAYDLRCKGITIYRDRSREDQLMNFTTTNNI